jgi:hypothetical protein
MHPVREGILQGRLCAMLRTKGMFVAGYDGPPTDLPFVPDTAAFWCNATGWALGPDSVPANPDRCVLGRSCFEAAVEV